MQRKEYNLSGLLGGLRASVTVADEEYRIIFMNDLAIEHYARWGGASLIGSSLLDCHNEKSRTTLDQMYERYRSGDLTPTRYYEDEGNGSGRNEVMIPLVIGGQFKGVAELIWHERPDLVFDA